MSRGFCSVSRNATSPSYTLACLRCVSWKIWLLRRSFIICSGVVVKVRNLTNFQRYITCRKWNKEIERMKRRGKDRSSYFSDVWAGDRSRMFKINEKCMGPIPLSAVTYKFGISGWNKMLLLLLMTWQRYKYRLIKSFN